jgi:uncharacterized membrane protein (DUF2068 family)
MSIRAEPRQSGAQKQGRFPQLRYELLGCGLHGHELVGTDVAEVRPEDHTVVRESGGLRWHRCLRCDAWLPLVPPEDPLRDHVPDRSEITLPLRGRPLRDRYVLRVIAVERMLRVLVVAAIAVAVFLFAANRADLHHDYMRILAAFQGAFGGPINNTGRGIFSEIDRLFALSTTTLYLLGAAAVGYAVILAAESIGLWRGRRWAEYLTLVEAGSLVPFEVYEVFNAASPLKVVSLVVNLAVVLYLLISKRLFGVRGGIRAERAKSEADRGWAAIDRCSPAVPVGDEVERTGGAAGPPPAVRVTG